MKEIASRSLQQAKQMTKILPANDRAAQNQAVNLLKNGDVVVFPTDTIYGIGASITQESGVQKIYEVKSRSPDKPLIIFIASLEQLPQITTNVPESVITSLGKLWPGGLSAIFPKNDFIPSFVTSGQDNVGVRIPNHPLCWQLVRQVGTPLAVTSANISGIDTPPTAPEISAQLGNRVPLVLDGGRNPQPQPSSIVDFTSSPPQLLREGVWSFSQLCQIIPDLQPISSIVLHANSKSGN